MKDYRDDRLGTAGLGGLAGRGGDGRISAARSMRSFLSPVTILGGLFCKSGPLRRGFVGLPMSRTALSVVPATTAALKRTLLLGRGPRGVRRSRRRRPNVRTLLSSRLSASSAWWLLLTHTDNSFSRCGPPSQLCRPAQVLYARTLCHQRALVKTRRCIVHDKDSLGWVANGGHRNRHLSADCCEMGIDFAILRPRETCRGARNAKARLSLWPVDKRWGQSGAGWGGGSWKSRYYPSVRSAR